MRLDVPKALPALLAVLVTLAAAPPGAAADTGDVDIPYQRFVLDNGLTLVVHEDRKAPIVAVHVWYHVGSKDEAPGRTGFAHLFEHLMFNGSENFDDDYFKALESVGATDVNGTTDHDRTHYFQTVPTPALDRVLFLESDRMGHLLGAVTREKLDEQIGVVRNEKLQFDNEPYAVSREWITRAAFPPGHPYSWTVLGSLEDLEAASLEDVHGWFEGYYGAANAVLVIAGDVDAAAVHDKVRRYFGAIPAGPPVGRDASWIARRTGDTRQRVEDRAPQARLYKVWNVPGFGTPEAQTLDVLADVLATGKSSRLDRRLVRQDGLATDVRAYVDEREIAGLFMVRATAVPGGDLAAVERAVDEELALLLEEGPTAAELERAIHRVRAAFVRGAERIGGLGGKSDVLARCQVYTGSPDCWKTWLARLDAMSPEQVAETGRAWLTSGAHSLEIHPFPEHRPEEEAVDRTRLPEPGAVPRPDFPPLRRTALSNGLEVVLVERHATPLVRLSLLVEAGYAADPEGRSGLASFTASMLDEGTGERDALAISDELARLGATLGTACGLDVLEVSMTALTSSLEPALDLFAGVALEPAFDEAEVERRRGERLAAIRREQTTMEGISLRTLPRLVYGGDHPYATPFTGSGFETTVEAITRDDLVAFHRTWFKPGNATLVVVGDVTLDQLRPLLEERFAGWRPGEVPRREIAAVENRDSAVYLVDRPGSVQSLILAGQVLPPRSDPREPALQAAVGALGGGFTSRLNLNLREDKGWAYVAGVVVKDTAAQRLLLLYAPVQADRTGEALAEALAEVRGVAGAEPVTAAELDRFRDDLVLGLPGRWESTPALAAAVEELVRFDLPDDHWSTYADTLHGLDLEAVRGAAAELEPDRLVWVVVGDRAQVEPQLREAGFGDVLLVDADGEPVE